MDVEPRLDAAVLILVLCLCSDPSEHGVGALRTLFIWGVTRDEMAVDHIAFSSARLSLEAS